jgi:thiol-disulfide isomerase/thioredoxin
LCAAALFDFGSGGSARAAQDQGAPKKGAATKAATAVAAAPKPAGEKPKVTEIKEAELKGLLAASATRGRPLLVNFWATWCVPCREEFPDLVKIREGFADDRLEFVTVSLDDPTEIATAVPDFLREMRATRMPAYLLHAADDEAAVLIVDKDWRGELPATFLFDAQGRLAFKHMGRVRAADLQAALEKTLSAK